MRNLTLLTQATSRLWAKEKSLGVPQGEVADKCVPRSLAKSHLQREDTPIGSPEVAANFDAAAAGPSACRAVWAGVTVDADSSSVFVATVCYDAGHDAGNNSVTLWHVNVEVPPAGYATGSATDETERTAVVFADLSQFFDLPLVVDRQRVPAQSAIVGIRYLQLQQAVCVATAQGDILLVCKGQADCCGSVDTGIACMEWSPDEEIFVLITGHSTLLLMTKEFDVLYEQPVHIEDAGAVESVNVGWGKKETQFHGTEGKLAALQSRGENCRFSPNDDGCTYVSWRGDGLFFAVSVVDKTKGRRVLRVYDREGVLQSTAEPVDGLEHALSWKPSGNLVAASQHNYAQNSHDVVFFEKNGLRHGQFSLREDESCKIVRILWNCDSSILAVHLERENAADSGNKPGSYVQLWTTSNYHWFLKQNVILPLRNDGHTDKIVAISWDVEKATVLHIVSESGRYFQNRYSWDYCVSAVHSVEENASTAAVVDGSFLNLTAFRYMNVPPPMSGFQIEFPAAFGEVTRGAPATAKPAPGVKPRVVEVTFAPSCHGNAFAVLTSDGSIWRGEVQIAKGAKKPTVKDVKVIVTDKTSVSNIPYIRTARKFTYVNAGTPDNGNCLFFAIVHQPDTDSDILLWIRIAKDGMEFTCGSIFGDTSTKARIVRVLNGLPDGNVAIVAEDGRVWQASFPSATLSPYPSLPRLPDQCEYVSLAYVGPSDSPELTLVGLTSRSKLYCGDRLVATDCTSFFVHNVYLIYTTLTHNLRFLALKTIFTNQIITKAVAEKPRFSSVECETVRRTEQGSRIVLALPFGVALILQMPRGNLETVYPRPLVLSTVASHLNRAEYRDAFLLCRKNRLDLNYLCDYAPTKFLDDMEQFVDQVKDVDHLNLFLSSIRNEDVTTIMPSLSQGNDRWENCAKCEVGQKVNNICDIMRGTVEKRDRKLYVNTILTSYVRKSPPGLEEALRMVQILFEESASHAEDALKYIIFLVDVDRLYDVALGMYDLRMVIMVAQHSQKDPREYLPFLSELQGFEKYFQRFKIDDHLGKREKALRNLSMAGDQHFEQCLQYMRAFSLYSTALALFKNDGQKFKRCLALYGDYLSEIGEYGQSALAYNSCGSVSDAIQAYNRACAWRAMFSLAHRENLPAEEIEAQARKVVDRLFDKGRFEEAARVLLDHVKDVDGAVAALIQGSCWMEASRIAWLHNREELIGQQIKPAVRNGYELLCEIIDDARELLEKQSARLDEIRTERKARRHHQDIESVPDNVETISDDATSAASSFSRATEATSIASVSSVRTGKTIKSRKKQQRKKWRGKKGSAHEEAYLVDSLYRAIERGNKQAGEVSDCLKALVHFGYTEEARDLQKRYAAVLREFDGRAGRIFTEEFARAVKNNAEEDEEFRNLPTTKPTTVLPEQWAISVLE